MSDPVVAKKGPFPKDLAPGTYFWCSCGRSKGQPFCDGSHQGSDFTPVKVEVKDSGTRYFCGCKHSIDAPWCDGTHNEF